MSTTHTIWSYDVWGNENDGWEVNDRCALDRALELTTTNSTEERTILDAIEAGPDVGIDWTQSDENRMELVHRMTGKPLGCIERND